MEEEDLTRRAWAEIRELEAEFFLLDEPTDEQRAAFAESLAKLCQRYDLAFKLRRR